MLEKFEWKNAKLILVITSNSINCKFKVWESTTVDTAAGVPKYEYAGSSFNSTQFITVLPEWDTIEKTFAAGKFITIEVTSAVGDNLRINSAYVIES